MEKAKEWFNNHKKDAIRERLKKDQLTLEEVNVKLEELLEKLASLKDKPEANQAEIGQVTLEIEALKELKAELTAEKTADCPICKDIEELGLKRTAKMLVLNLGLDNVMGMFENEKVNGPLWKMIRVDTPESKTPEATPVVEKPVEIETDALLKRVEKQRNLTKKLNG